MTRNQALTGYDITQSIDFYEDRIKQMTDEHTVTIFGQTWISKSLLDELKVVVVKHCESKIEGFKKQLEEL